MRRRRGVVAWVLAWLAVLMLLALASTLGARVSGPCSDCHTMHNSQDAAPMAYGFTGSSYEAKSDPNANLLITDCLGCHSALDGSTWKDSTTGAPIVFNTSEPNYGASSDGGTTRQGLAAGNFYWAGQDDANGHNIMAADGSLSTAPGNSVGCGGDSCHNNLDRPYGGAGFLNGRSACTGCHMVSGSVSPSVTGWHHKDDAGPIVNTAEQGWYRFLAGHETGDGHGVAGLEDDDWEHTTSSSDHNEYLGSTGDKTDSQAMAREGNTMSGFCAGCHGNFHEQNTSPAGSSPWIRHPSDAVIPAGGEYTAFIAYDPLVPVARASLGGTASPAVTPGSDMVMCLSCHRAHASPYYKMMRWDYRSGDLSTSLSGCGVCHTKKN
ncbi:cytochrome c3 family protein [Desulfovibrio ferrophilus]|uniref:Doubled CXXCH domain protein n=1 Tax=Desulfovibrio ferrophilus TaxID=241368 RepID=A0A2Z6AVE5_9BACT|nr:cytochrome c3 family protein [Desulfovibrio ferrophilus]BBD07190.1 doubled CXXCH domain protein [Desulfovibrio ferrophilus]